MNLLRSIFLWLVLMVLSASAAQDLRSVSYDFTTKRAMPTNFFGSNVLGGYGITIHLSTNGTITLSNAFSVALSNLCWALGASGTNYTDERAVALSNLSYSLGTAGTNYTVSTSNFLAAIIAAADSAILQSATNHTLMVSNLVRLAAGLAATNHANAILQSGTNYANGVTNSSIVRQAELNAASNVLWSASGGGGTPGGSSGAIQFNQSGAFDGTNDFTYDRTSGNLAVPYQIQSTFGWFHTPNTSVILSADDTLFVLSDVFKSIYSTDPTVSLGGNDLPFASVAAHFAYSATNVVTNCLAVGSENGGKLIVNFTNKASSTSNSAVVISNALAHVPSNTVHTASLAIVGAAVTTGVSNTVHPSWTLNNLPDAGGMEGAFQTIWRTNTENGVIVSTLAMGGLSVRPDTDTTHTFGRVRLGSPASDIMYVSHFDRLGTGDYAVRQTAAGATAINATAGQSITFSLQNSSIGAFSSAGNFGVGINVAQALVHLTNSVAGTNVLRVTQRGALANDIANFEHGTSNSFSFKTNGFVHLTATVFAPMTAVAGPSWVTNGMSAIWNSNGIATYIRSSTVGSATNLDTVLKVH